MGYEISLMANNMDSSDSEGDVCFSNELKTYVASVGKSFNADILKLTGKDNIRVGEAISTATLLTEILHKFLETSNGETVVEVKNLLRMTFNNLGCAYRK